MKTLRQFFLENGYTISKPGKYLSSSVIRRKKDNCYRLDISDNQLDRPFIDAFDTMLIVALREKRESEKYQEIKNIKTSALISSYLSEYGY